MFAFPFFSHTDKVGYFVIALLLGMSVISWFLILLKSWQYLRLNSANRHFSAEFSVVNTFSDIQTLANTRSSSAPLYHVLTHGIQACRLIEQPEAIRGFESSTPDDFISAALHAAIAEAERIRDKGVSILATIGSTAPFVGLFGTVWGIYHALMAISQSGQNNLDQVAAPVGEALIMTACGLAVALPAVWGYNAFVRASQRQTGYLEKFAHNIFGLLGFGRVK
ncbi:MotA/TolQ/ExbB proton channel family protein [Buttiauxella noackiae]|uniref:MotA/TolQ/ExbB proton channel family protein n=1 Tax=Buttiauxella noackiae TaxID=82992 RepID=UPI0028D033CC|nr:MotA/TolQ/ExbB proton channel family protein [Buttiauxella noackiae]